MDTLPTSGENPRCRPMGPDQMSDAERASQRRRHHDDEVEATTDDEVRATDEATDLDDVDALLDEIDAVLEENAEDFVRNYVQKGGQ